MYDQKDLFRHMVAMRGKHGYAEGASHAEDVDLDGASVPLAAKIMRRAPPMPRTSTGAARPSRRGDGRWARYGPYQWMRCWPAAAV